MCWEDITPEQYTMLEETEAALRIVYVDEAARAQGNFVRTDGMR